MNDRMYVAVATRMAVKLRLNWRERAMQDNAIERPNAKRQKR